MHSALEGPPTSRATALGSVWRSTWWVLALAVVPLVYPDSYLLHLMIIAMDLAVLASSWNLLLGYTGIFSFGHQAFFGLGAYVSALLTMHGGVSPWLGMPVAGMVSAIISPVIALPCLRLRGAPYISIATLSFAEICRITAMNLVGITRGELGLWGIPALIQGGSRVPFYYIMLAILTLTQWTVVAIVQSNLGLAFRSVRDSEAAAEALGVDISQTQTLAFVISSFIAGVAGAFHAHYLQILTPSSVLSVELMVRIVMVTLLGGLGTYIGPVLGAFGLTLGLEHIRFLGDYRFLVYGGSIVLLILFVPEGLLPGFRRWFSRLRSVGN